MINLEKFKHKSWLDGRIIAINGDCQKVMAEIGDKKIDLCLTDPPYGININHNMGRRKGDKSSDYAKVEWDDKPMSAALFNEIFRISKNQIIWGANHFINRMPLNSPCWLVWDKQFSEDVSFAQLEMAWTSYDKTCKKFVKHPAQQDRIHPTQKPLELFNWCLLKNSQENDLIFDGFLGSGTTAISCIKTKRRFIGCELDKEYFEKACERIDIELKQLTLF